MEAKRKDALRDTDLKTDTNSDDGLPVKEEVEERREMDERGDVLPDPHHHRRLPPSESSPDR